MSNSKDLKPVKARPVHSPIYVRPARAKEVFGVHPATLYRWAAAGHISIHKRGAMSFVKVEEVCNFIERGLGG